MRIRIIYVTIGLRDAPRFSRELVERRLAACVNIVRVTSIYRWKGEVEEDEEALLIIKTFEDRVEELKRYILENHPYELPEFIVISPSDVYKEYGDWVIDSCSI